jgi:hypothetical protein
LHACRNDELRLVHPSVPNAVAERLGARSLRYLFLVDKEMTDRLACPPAAALATLLAGYDDASSLLYDILDVADAVGASGVEFTLDERTHGRQSLLSPGLAACQGPALLARIEGVVLSEGEICSLLAAAPPVKLRGRACRYGNGLTVRRSLHADACIRHTHKSLNRLHPFLVSFPDTIKRRACFTSRTCLLLSAATSCTFSTRPAPCWAVAPATQRMPPPRPRVRRR